MALEEFAENGNHIFSLGSENINEEAFKTFIDQFGPDVAKGYIMAISDLQKRVKDIYFVKMKEDRYYTPSHKEMEKRATRVFEDMDRLLHCVSNLSLPMNDVLPPSTTKVQTKRPE